MHSWSMALVEDQKSRIKADLDRLAPHADLSQRSQLIRTKMESLAYDDTSLGRLKRYIYVVSSLVLHLRSPSMSASQARHGLELAFAILKAQGICPKKSSLAPLYGDLHFIKSQLDRIEGDHIKAAWHQQIGILASGAQPSGGLDSQKMILGNRVLRLGHADLALSYYSSLDQDEGSPFWARGRLERIRALRLSGRPEEAQELLHSTLKKESLAKSVRSEARWEGLCLNLILDQKVDPVLGAIKPKGSHCEPSYILEGILWCLSRRSRRMVSSLPSAKNLDRRAIFKREKGGRGVRSLRQAACVLQDCYDYEIPLWYRQKKLGEILVKTSSLFNIDKEILIWAAATRWFLRSKLRDQAAFALKEYQGHCLKLSSGRTRDVLNVFKDLSESMLINL